jgi:hypothetical protein
MERVAVPRSSIGWFHPQPMAVHQRPVAAARWALRAAETYKFLFIVFYRDIFPPTDQHLGRYPSQLRVVEPHPPALRSQHKHVNNLLALSVMMKSRDGPAIESPRVRVDCESKIPGVKWYGF